MFTSYIIDKSGFTLICMLIGGREDAVPDGLVTTVDSSNYETVLKKLSDVGYVHVSHDRVDIERTIRFLVSQILSAEETENCSSENRYIFHCPKLIIIAETDRLSAKKCKLIPIKDEDMLAEYFREISNEFQYEEE